MGLFDTLDILGDFKSHWEVGPFAQYISKSGCAKIPKIKAPIPRKQLISGKSKRKSQVLNGTGWGSGGEREKNKEGERKKNFSRQGNLPTWFLIFRPRKLT